MRVAGGGKAAGSVCDVGNRAVHGVPKMLSPPQSHADADEGADAGTLQNIRVRTSGKLQEHNRPTRAIPFLNL